MTLTYDNNGNLTSNGAWNYVWDYNNRLIQAVSPTATTTYAYNHTGQRVKLDNGSESTLYPNKYYNENSNSIIKHIFAGGQLIATVQGTGVASSTINFIHTDHLGGTNVVSDETGAQAELNDYYPFGEFRINESSVEEQRKYTGHEYDSDTDLTYANARYYNQEVGRWLSQDSAFQNLDRIGTQLTDPQSWNSYTYARNNPLVNVDVTGEFSLRAALLNPFTTAVQVVGAQIGAKLLQAGVYKGQRPATAQLLSHCPE